MVIERADVAIADVDGRYRSQRERHGGTGHRVDRGSDVVHGHRSAGVGCAGVVVGNGHGNRVDVGSGAGRRVVEVLVCQREDAAARCQRHRGVGTAVAPVHDHRVGVGGSRVGEGAGDGYAGVFVDRRGGQGGRGGGGGGGGGGFCF